MSGAREHASKNHCHDEIDYDEAYVVKSIIEEKRTRTLLASKRMLHSMVGKWHVVNHSDEA